MLSLGGFFTPLVFAFTLLAAAGLLVLAPSLLEELSPSENVDARGVQRGAAVWSERLGGLADGAGCERLGSALTGLVPIGAIGGGVLYFSPFVLQQFAFAVGVADAPGDDGWPAGSSIFRGRPWFPPENGSLAVR